MKDPWTEDPKVRGIKLASSPPQHSNNNELFDKARKEKKKKRRWRDQKRWKGSTPATGVNSAHTGELYQKKKNQGCSDRASHNTSQINCYNCRKMGHYAIKCLEPKN